MSDFPEGLIWQRHSALEVLDLIARDRLSAQQVLEQTLAAIAHGDPAVGAFTAVLSGSALARACAAREPGPLGGLPIGLKDIIDTTDLPTPMVRRFMVPRLTRRSRRGSPQRWWAVCAVLGAW